jgi:hypothetical protein
MSQPFVGSGYGETRNETLQVWWYAEKGILLCFDTYGGDSVNGGKFYYNIKLPESPRVPWSVTSSGGSREDPVGGYIWVGDHDCREGVRFHIDQLAEHGKFVTPWIEQPFLWLLHYMDTKDKKPGCINYKEVNRQRIAMLPQDVQDAIRGTKERS